MYVTIIHVIITRFSTVCKFHDCPQRHVWITSFTFGSTTDVFNSNDQERLSICHDPLKQVAHAIPYSRLHFCIYLFFTFQTSLSFILPPLPSHFFTPFPFSIISLFSRFNPFHWNYCLKQNSWEDSKGTGTAFCPVAVQGDVDIPGIAKTINIYTVNHKKRDILFLTITVVNLDRFLQLLYHFNREEIQHAIVVIFTTSL